MEIVITGSVSFWFQFGGSLYARLYIVQRANARGTLRTEISQGNQEKVQCDTRSLNVKLFTRILHLIFTIYNRKSQMDIYSNISSRCTKKRKKIGMIYIIYPTSLRDVQLRSGSFGSAQENAYTATVTLVPERHDDCKELWIFLFGIIREARILRRIIHSFEFSLQDKFPRSKW